MPDPVKRRTLVVRLNEVERIALERRARGRGLSTYVKSVLFGDVQPSTGTRRVSADRVLLAQILGQLGGTGLASSLRRLTEAADSGSLHLDDLTIKMLHDACDDVRGMHMHLLKALGKKLRQRPASKPERLSVQFIRAASDSEAGQ